MNKWDEYLEMAKKEIYDKYVEIGMATGYIVDWGSEYHSTQPRVYFLNGDGPAELPRGVYVGAKEIEGDIIFEVGAPLGYRLSERTGGLHPLSQELYDTFKREGKV